MFVFVSFDLGLERRDCRFFHLILYATVLCILLFNKSTLIFISNNNITKRRKKSFSIPERIKIQINSAEFQSGSSIWISRTRKKKKQNQAIEPNWNNIVNNGIRWWKSESELESDDRSGYGTTEAYKDWVHSLTDSDLFHGPRYI